MRLPLLLLVLSVWIASALSQAVPANDLVALNYALTLEHLEASFYTGGLAKFAMSDFQAAGYNTTVYTYFVLIKNHEVAHVNTLTTVIQSLGGSPVPACTYNFNFDTVPHLVATAQALENAGVSAYTGAIQTIQTEALLMAAATIATVEARHAAYLNEINGAVPFPAAQDTPVVPADVVPIVTPFLASCPYQLQLPLNVTRGSTSAASAAPVPSASLWALGAAAASAVFLTLL